MNKDTLAKKICLEFGVDWDDYIGYSGKHRVPDIISFITMAITLAYFSKGKNARDISNDTNRKIQTFYYAKKRVIDFVYDKSNPLVQSFISSIDNASPGIIESIEDFICKQNKR